MAVERRLKILHVIPGVAPRYGGPSAAVLSMARALLAQGVDALIATTDADGDGELAVAREHVVSFADVPVIFFHRQWSEGFKFSWPLARWLTAHVAEFDAVHIHAVWSHSSLAAGRESRHRRVPYVVRPLGSLDNWSRRQKPGRKWLMWHIAARSLMRRAAAIHYTSPGEKQEVERGVGLERGVVIPLSIATEEMGTRADEALFRADVPELGENPYVLALCRIHPVKALEGLVDAFLDATDDPRLQPWRLVIAGGGEATYVARLQDRVAARCAGSRVLFPGWVSGKKKAGALYGAGLLALTSRHENFGIAVAEAMLSGVPVVVSGNVNIAPEVNAQKAGWVSPLDRPLLASAIREALDDPGERRRRGEAGRRLAQTRFGEARMGEQLVELYRSIQVRR